MSAEICFTKNNLDNCLRALGKEFRKLNGTKMPAEIILVGGASILANYGFRDMTYDIDALIHASSAMKEAISKVGDSMNLPNGWLNSDFIKTKSFSPKLFQYSSYYKTFSHILKVRTVSGEYLVAMKLMSDRQYKNDISDIVGILWEQKKWEKPLSFSDINQAVKNLYGGWKTMPQDAKPLISSILENDNLEKLYQKYRAEETFAKNILIDFEKDYPHVTKEYNLSEILSILKNRQTISK